MRTRLLAIALAALAIPNKGMAAQDLVLVQGAAGEPEFGEAFDAQVAAWQRFAKSSRANLHFIDDSDSAKQQLQTALGETPKEGGDLWLVLIGHGSFDGRNAKFNLAGDDVSAKELAEWLEPFHRRLIVLNFFSASGAFLPELAGRERIVLTATRSGGERNYSRLGEMFAQSMQDPESDLDGDGTTSLLEAAVSAQGRVTEFYKSEQRIVPEHGLLDDNGDRVGTALSELTADDAMDGEVAGRITIISKNPPPDFTNDELRQREALEQEIAALRARKPFLKEGAYYTQLEQILLKLADVYAKARAREESAPD